MTPAERARRRSRRLVVTLTADQVELLDQLASSPAVGVADLPRQAARVHAVLQYLASSAADGVRRPGSWERAWLLQAFGDIDDIPERGQ